MVTPSLRHRAGAIEIKNRLMKQKEEKKKKEWSEKKEIVSKEEHEERLRKLKEIGVIKDER